MAIGFSASASPEGSEVPLTVQFKGSSGNRFLWEFGDGKTSTEQNPVHTYTEPGLYSVILHSFEDDLEIGVEGLTISVLTLNPIVTAIDTISVGNTVSVSYQIPGGSRISSHKLKGV